MDLTPRLLTEVEFREQWRGYRPSDVDDFLERVALALGELQEQLREVSERAAAAERRLLDRSADDDEICRTLVLAQRAAAIAVEDAKAQAARILAEAEETAGHLADGETQREDPDAELAERRRALEHEIEALATLAESHRTAMRAELTRLLAELDDPNPAPVPTEPPVVSPSPEAGEPTASFDVLTDVEDDGAGDELRWVDGQATGDAEPESESESESEPESEPEPLRARDDDPFLAELRRSVTDTEPLGPRDDEDVSFDVGWGQHPEPSGRFRLRRGR